MAYKAKKLIGALEFLPLLSDIAENRHQEHFVVLSLDSGYHLIARRTVFIGTLNAVLMHPREIFAHAISDHAAGLIVAHNHPSGDVSPSNDDISTTQSLVAGGILLGIKVLDHIIVAGDRHFSFRQRGML